MYFFLFFRSIFLCPFLSPCFCLQCLVTTSTDCGFSGFIGCKLAGLLLIPVRKMEWESWTSALAQQHTKKEAQRVLLWTRRQEMPRRAKIKSLTEEIHLHHHSSKRTQTEEQLSTKSVRGVSECQCLPLESISLSFAINFHFCKAWGIS